VAVAYTEIFVTERLLAGLSRQIHLLESIADFQRGSARYGGLGEGIAGRLGEWD